MAAWTIEQLIEGYRQKRFSPTEVIRQHLERIRRSNPELNAFITVSEETALAQAAEAERRLRAGEDAGALCGVPVSFKDNIDTRGIRTTNGSRIDKDYVPEANAAVVEALYAAGAVNVGKTNLYEYAMGITSHNPHYGPIRNPWNAGVTAGGSSGGSAAAVAAGLCFASIGTDTSGSVRVPASCNGVLGLKPTYGEVDMAGIMPLSRTLDHAGAFAANAKDLAVVAEALLGRSFRGELGQGLRGVRIGVPRAHFAERLAPAVDALYRRALRALEGLGAALVDVDVPVPDAHLLVARTIGTAEVSYEHHERRQTSEALYGDGIRETFERSLSISSFAYIDALRRRHGMIRGVSAVFAEVDLVVTPTMPMPPAAVGTETVDLGGARYPLSDAMVRCTQLFNLTGHPALSIPCGQTDDGLPVGLQLVAAHRAEGTLLRAACAYEEAELAELYARRTRLANVEA